jgi:hypothetical protein
MNGETDRLLEDYASQVAQDSVTQLEKVLDRRFLDFQAVLVKPTWSGKHLAVLGVGSGNQFLHRPWGRSKTRLTTWFGASLVRSHFIIHRLAKGKFLC